ncbi:hypothetical protein GHK92_20135 [Nocardioides sp. dk4132]|uniref:Pycsar system effector family protein n=1 Tax=unclassified Nocardioides TaxID=2615069 RepID=UPI0012961831|nr:MULTISPECIES: Pycsar system effector family protein [unclassified Nocardioides]MQW78180.1 hypothetical protein [Nocardioides sp. dk4132]QGA07154.1 hypothetical protein GFH29_06980 [Nocardioides sp. dk884]
MTDTDDSIPAIANWPSEPDPDHAWKALSLVNDWIRHGDAKIGVTLAVTGAAGVMLFNIVKDAQDPGCWLVVPAWLAAGILLLAAAFAVVGLVPKVKVGRRRDPEAYTNLLFYKHIAGGYEGKPADFVHKLGSLTFNKQELTKHIGEQVHANAAVARRKFEWADRAIKGLAGGLLFVALTGIARVVA